jgi:hypothetical protein
VLRKLYRALMRYPVYMDPRSKIPAKFKIWARHNLVGLQVIINKDSVMSIGNLLDLAAALEAGIVPADMVNVGFVRTLYEVWRKPCSERVPNSWPSCWCAQPLLGRRPGLGWI